MALYFAARGQGVVQTDNGMQEYTSKANILLSGLGADELFGGYGRHRRAFEQTQRSEEQRWAALTEELEMDLTRIGTRNLGRDDRCLSRFGKEARCVQNRRSCHADDCTDTLFLMSKSSSWSAP